MILLGNNQCSCGDGFFVQRIHERLVGADAGEGGVETFGSGVPLGEVSGIGLEVVFQGGFFNSVRDPFPPGTSRQSMSGQLAKL